MPTRFGRRWIYLSLALSVFLADQLSKFWAVSRLTRLFERADGSRFALYDQIERFLWVQPERPYLGAVNVLKGTWDFQYIENPGSAFGFLARADESWRTPAFIVVSILVMGFVAYTFYSSHPDQKFLRIGLAAVMGGALGNFFDRARLGYVIDFIDWHWGAIHWPTFNVADAGISIGVGLFVLDMLTFKHPQPEQEQDPV